MASAKPGSDPALAELVPEFAPEVRIAPVPQSLAGATASGVLWQANSRSIVFEIPHTARVLVCKDEIMVDLFEPGARVRLAPLLRRTPLAALSYLRKAFACNGAALCGPDGAVLLIGPTVSGKSTIAAALLKRGLRLMADDAATIVLEPSGRPVIAPIWPELVLWPDAIAGLFPAGPPQWLEPRACKFFGVPYWGVGRDHFCAQPQPLKAVYRIQRDTLDDTTRRDSVKGFASLTTGALLPYHGRIAGALADPEAVMRIYGAAMSAAPFHAVKLPYDNFAEVENFADRIMQECEWSIAT